MSTFEEAVDFVLANEKGLNVSPKDRGGITNFGISLRFLRELPAESLRKYGIFDEVNEETIRSLTLEQAKFIYRGEFWDEAPFEKIEWQLLCNYIFDMVINMGMSQAIKLVQRAICAATLIKGFVKDDGIFGQKTLSELNSTDDELINVLVAIRVEFYRHLISVRPEQYVNFDGWVSRCYNVT